MKSCSSATACGVDILVLLMVCDMVVAGRGLWCGLVTLCPCDLIIGRMFSACSDSLRNKIAISRLHKLCLGSDGEDVLLMNYLQNKLYV